MKMRPALKHFIAAVIALLFPLNIVSHGNATPSSAGVEEAERQTRAQVQKFFRGIVDRDPEAVHATIHPALSKLGVIPNFRGSPRSVLLDLTPGTLDVLARYDNQDGHLNPETASARIEVVDATDNLAVAFLGADTSWFDYWLAVRVNDEWRFVNCVWGGYNQIVSETPEADQAAILAASKAYAAAFANADFKALKETVHLDFARRSLKKQNGAEWVAQESLESIALELSGKEPAAAPQISYLGSTQVAGAIRIDAADRQEWVFLLKIDDQWRPVNSFWIART